MATKNVKRKSKTKRNVCYAPKPKAFSTFDSLLERNKALAEAVQMKRDMHTYKNFLSGCSVIVETNTHIDTHKALAHFSLNVQENNKYLASVAPPEITDSADYKRTIWAFFNTDRNREDCLLSKLNYTFENGDGHFSTVNPDGTYVDYFDKNPQAFVALRDGILGHWVVEVEMTFLQRPVDTTKEEFRAFLSQRIITPELAQDISNWKSLAYGTESFEFEIEDTPLWVYYLQNSEADKAQGAYTISTNGFCADTDTLPKSTIFGLASRYVFDMISEPEYEYYEILFLKMTATYK